MRILSVDLGARNLAWCVLDREKSSKEEWSCPPFRGMEVCVHAWRVIDIVKESGVVEDVNLNKTDIATCVPWFVTAIKHWWGEMTEGVDLAVLEAQPTARVMNHGERCVNNVRTKVLSHVLQAFLLEKNIPVQFVSPAVKLRDAKDLMADASEYREHKKAAVLLTTRACALLDDKARATWETTKGKRDDLADAFLQGVCFSVKKARKPKKSAKPVSVFEEDTEEGVPAPDIPTKRLKNK
jgi:hypothetical protein